jgi:hypothetical protein
MLCSSLRTASVGCKNTAAVVRAAKSGFGPRLKILFREPQQGGKGNNERNVVRKMAAGRKCCQHNISLIASDTKEKDKNICNIVRPPFGPPDPCNIYRLPPSRKHWLQRVPSGNDFLRC